MVYTRVENLLTELEAALKAAQLWRSSKPPLTALMSTAPFCCDTLTLEEWLQFLFIPQMQFLLKQRRPLPGQSGIAVMAEQVWRLQSPKMQLIYDLLKALDSTLTESREING